MAPSPPGAPLGLYLHIPFCSHVCPYCDFNTYSGQEALIPRYVQALEREIGRTGAEQRGCGADTIFIGGGTPSLLTPEQIGRLIHACREAFAVNPGAEVTLEANPNSVDAAYFSGLLEAGVNRLSIGVQTLHRRGLRTLGRQHEAEDAERAFRAAREAGYRNISLDLIFGWPGQTPEIWGNDLETVLSWPAGPDHLSLYSLIVEPGTPMADAVARGILAVPDDDATADLYEAAITRLTGAGWTHYEVANWARIPSLGSRHNLIYWRNGEYAGCGAGAHGRLGGTRTMNHLAPRAYIEAIEAGRSPISNHEELPERTHIAETMMLGLRLLEEGVGVAEFEARHGRSLDNMFAPAIRELAALGMLDVTPEHIRLTHRGLMVANDVCARFL
jgi:oxygen-independent coproporphyrinogen-3 oxidase